MKPISSYLAASAFTASILLSFSTDYAGAQCSVRHPRDCLPHPHINLPPAPHPHINLPPAQKPIVNEVVNLAKRLPGDAKDLVDSGVKTVFAEPKNIVLVVAGKESLSDAAKQTVAAYGNQLETAATIAQKGTSDALHIPIAVGDAVAGNPGKTYMTIVTGEAQYILEFGVTAATYAAEIARGTNPKAILGLGVAGAIRTAYAQYDQVANPIPEEVKSALLSKGYPKPVLDQARFAITSGFSLAVTDVANK